MRGIALPAVGALLILGVCCLSCKHLRGAAGALLLVLAGIGTQVWHRQNHTPVLDVADGQIALLQGCVTNPPVFSPMREQFTLNLTPRSAIRLTVNVKEGLQPPALPYGTKAEVAAKVRIPRNFQNPDSFDYAGYLAAQHIYWTGSVSSPSDVRVLPGNCGFRPLSWLFAVRTWALQRLTALYADDLHTAAILQATLLGETAAVDRRWTSDFRVTGTYHALVISGQHVSVLAVSILFLLRVLRFRRIPALGVATLACWLYAFISGFSSPVVRAAGGFTLFLIASYVFRRTRILNILGAVGLVYLAAAPDELLDPSFQLSFLSAAAIAAFAVPAMEHVTEPLRNAVKRFDQVRYDPQLPARAAAWRVEFRLVAETIRLWTGLAAPRAQFLVAKGVLIAAFMLDAVLVSACVQFGLALPMVSYFHRLSITGLSANIFVIPLLSLVVPLGFATILTGLPALAAITKALLCAAEAVAGWHVRFEPAWRIASTPLVVSLSFAVLLVILGIVVRHRRAFVFPSAAASLVLFGLICWQPWAPIVHA
ncbi:MAG: ComEC family competence protein, partial [Acidobacteriaceae bacterium]|nr:ComEC family competence protein [Acidobacteriaceae bacterium]